MRNYEAIRYSSADGELELYARDYPAEGDEGMAGPLLLMHGLTRNSADFEPLIEALDPSRRLIVPDQRGRGRSDYDEDPERYRPDAYVEDMWALLDRLGIERVVCIGTSMGGLMAMMMAGQRPHRIAGMVLNDIGPEVCADGLARLRSYVGAGSAMRDWNAAARECARINGDVLEGLGDEEWSAFARRTCVELDDGSVRFAYDPAIASGIADDDASAVPPDLWPLWDSFADMPALVVRGANSDILAADTVATMKRRHPAAFHSVEIAKRGHAPLLDEPEAVSAIDTFLTEHFA